MNSSNPSANDLTVGAPFGKILRFSLPIIGGNLFQLFYTLADSVIVGKALGARALAAVGATSMVVYFVLCFIQGMTNGFGICLAHRCGARDQRGMRQSIAASAILCTFFTLIITVVTCSLTHPILVWVKTPADIYEDAYAYVFIILLGTGATFFYNMISNILRSLGDSKTPLYYLIFSSVLNVVLDIVFLVPLHMGVAGAAWATVLAQLISSVLCLISGLRKFSVLHLTSRDFRNLKSVMVNHLKIGFPMGFQMSVMCIGLLSMQSSVNALGSVAVAGYTAATKADQISVLVNNALSAALASFVSQNYGAGRMDRVRQGVRANLIQTEVLNLLMCAGILLFRNHIVAFFVSDPTPEMITYSNMYVHVVAPCYLLLGALSVFRCAIQSMQNSLIPFLACIIELFCRIISTKAVCAAFGYIGVCLATPLAWVGACTLLIPSYFVVISKSCLAKNSTQ